MVVGGGSGTTAVVGGGAVVVGGITCAVVVGAGGASVVVVGAGGASVVATGVCSVAISTITIVVIGSGAIVVVKGCIIDSSNPCPCARIVDSVGSDSTTALTSSSIRIGLIGATEKEDKQLKICKTIKIL